MGSIGKGGSSDAGYRLIKGQPAPHSVSYACPHATYQNEHYEWVPEPCHRTMLPWLKSLQTSSLGRHVPAPASLSKAALLHVTMHAYEDLAHVKEWGLDPHQWRCELSTYVAHEDLYKGKCQRSSLTGLAALAR